MRVLILVDFLENALFLEQGESLKRLKNFTTTSKCVNVVDLLHRYVSRWSCRVCVFDAELENRHTLQVHMGVFSDLFSAIALLSCLILWLLGFKFGSTYVIFSLNLVEPFIVAWTCHSLPPIECFYYGTGNLDLDASSTSFLEPLPGISSEIHAFYNNETSRDPGVATPE